MRFRLCPTQAQEELLLGHCDHARFVWNLALEQANYFQPERGPTPNFYEQCVQLTEARAASEWLAAGSYTVQQQALRDFAQAMRNFWGGSHGRPRWRCKGVHEGFRIVAVRQGHVRRLNRRWGLVKIPKLGWVRFRWTRNVGVVKSYRVNRDRAGRWHVAFAKLPLPIDRRPTGAAVGLDRGVTNTLATSEGALFHCPHMTTVERSRAARLQRRLTRQQRGSGRWARTQLALARLSAKERDRVKDWVEKTTTVLVIDHDLIVLERLAVQRMTRSARGTAAHPGKNVRAKAGLNREILARRWGMVSRRLKEKAILVGVDVVEVPARYTSQRCSACGHVAAESRKSQATFACVACKLVEHADVNAARNILAAGRAVTARGGEPLSPSKREPQLRGLPAAQLESAE